jgi:hypothetical protein
MHGDVLQSDRLYTLAHSSVPELEILCLESLDDSAPVSHEYVNAHTFHGDVECLAALRRECEERDYQGP